MQYMKKILFSCAIAIAFLACNTDKTFRVEGTISDAEGKMLYLDYTALLKTTTLDSVKLQADGNFNFKVAVPEYPDFYRLRLDNKNIAFAVDSTETIHIEASFNNFSTDYTISGSESSVHIQELRKSASDIQRKINMLKPDMSVSERRQKLAEVEKDIEAHKEKARNIILANPKSTEAYFAIYQQISDVAIFSQIGRASCRERV